MLFLVFDDNDEAEEEYSTCILYTSSKAIST